MTSMNQTFINFVIIIKLNWLKIGTYKPAITVVISSVDNIDRFVSY